MLRILERVFGSERVDEIVKEKARELLKRQERHCLYRASVVVAQSSDVPVVRDKLDAFLKVIETQSVTSVTQLLEAADGTYPLAMSALDDLVLVVRLAHAEDKLPRALEKARADVLSYRPSVASSDGRIPTSGPLRKLVI